MPIIVCTNDDPGVTLTYFTARSTLVTLAFSIGKSENSGFLAQMSQRLIGELIGYSWSGVRPSSVRRPSVRCKQFQTSSSPKPLA